AFAMAALTSMGVADCGDDDDGDGGGGEDVSDASFDLTVGALVPLTGDLSQFGPPGQKAAELAIEEANAALEGTDISVTIENADTQTEPQAAQTAAQQLISNG